MQEKDSMELTMLPTELLLKIMAFLDHTDLVHLSAVNTLLHDMTQDEVCELREHHPPTIKQNKNKNNQRIPFS